MPTLFKRSNGFYYTILTDKLGRRKWISTKERTKQSALRKLTQIDDGRQEPIPRVLLQSFYDDFKKYAGQVYRSETVGVYERAFRKFIEYTGNKILSAVSARDIDMFKMRRLREVSPVTVNIELRTLRSAFYTALRWKITPENPFKGVKLCDVDDVTPPYFSLADFRKLISAISEDWFRNVVIVAVLTGMRRGEILNLRWGDVDLQHRLIRIQSRESYRTKRGKKRLIPINPNAFRVIEGLATSPQSDYVFTCEGNRILDRALSLRFKRLVRRQKLDDRLHFHSLRHTFASWLIQEGVSIYDVQKIMGHSSIRVTEIYSHLAPQQLHRSVERIPFTLN